MATTIASLMATLGIDTSQFDKGIDHAKGKSNELSGAFSGLSMVGGAILKTGFVAAAAGASLLGVELYKDVQAAADAQKVQEQLNAVLKSTGGVAGVTADQANALANSLSQVTMFDDEAITSGESLLLTFTGIGKDVFPQTTQVMLDMSQAMGQDLKSSAIQLGKALNDPEKGMTALTRVGVTFTEEQKKQVKAMEDSGNIMGAQKIILGELQREFGGSAEAAGKTFPGQLKILQTSLENIRESIGAKLLPVLSNLFSIFAAWVNKPEIQAFIQALADKIAQLANAFLVGFGDNGDLIGGISNALYLLGAQYPILNQLGDTIVWLADTFQNNKAVVVGVLAVIGAAVGAFAITTISAFISMVAAALPLILTMAAIGVAAYLLYRIWTENWGGIHEKFAAFVAWFTATWQNVWTTVQPIFKAFTTYITLVWQAFSYLFQGNFYKFGQTLRTIWDAGWKAIGNILKSAAIYIGGIVGNLIIELVNKFKTTDWRAVGTNILQGIGAGLQAASSWLYSVIVGIAQGILETLQGFFGISSPSKLMEKTIGANLALGVNQGWANNLDLAPVSVSSVLPSTTSSLNTANVSNGNPDQQIITLLERIANQKQLDEKTLAVLIRDAVAQAQSKK